MGVASTHEIEDGAATRTEADQSQKAEHASDATDHGSRRKSGNITVILANAGQTLEGADAELVLNPLRLAFETKNLKILEPALDCLHVWTRALSTLLEAVKLVLIALMMRKHAKLVKACLFCLFTLNTETYCL